MYSATLLEAMRILFMGLEYPNWMVEQLEKVYEVINFQDVWSSSIDDRKKELMYRESMDGADLLFNYHTGLFFWAKASYAKLHNKFVVTCWDGDDVNKIITCQNGYLGHQMIDLHIALNKEVKTSLDNLGIASTLLQFDRLKEKEWINDFQNIVSQIRKTN